VLALHPQARLVGIDSSPEMLAAARSALPGADLQVGRLQDRLPEGPFDLTVAALVIHHLDSADKRDLFHRVAGVMRPGGRFVIADVIIPDDPEDAVTPLHADFDLPDRLDDQLTWLANVGFRSIPTWRQQDLVVIQADRQ
jgi:tRNA (cmo5U34)-methyltransferase